LLNVQGVEHEAVNEACYYDVRGEEEIERRRSISSSPRTS
jgi:hypothetical protein